MSNEAQEWGIVFTWTLSNHITYTHVNTQICILFQCTVSRMQSIPEKFMIHLTQLNIVSSSQVRWSTGMVNSLHVNKYETLALLNLNHKYPSTLTWKHWASLQSLCINFGGESSTIATLMFAVLHVLLNSFALLNPVQSYHLHARQYTDMHPFAMHRFQGWRASLKSLWYI